jgi:hypothetical protein
VPFDEVGLQQQRLRLGVGDGHLERLGPGDHLPDALAPRVGVRPDTVLERNRLSDVQHPVVGLELVDARLVGQLTCTLADRRGVHTRLSGPEPLERTGWRWPSDRPTDARSERRCAER